MEEIIDEEEIINNIINNSLFRVQIEANNIDVNLIKQPLIKIVKEIEISPEEAKVYSKTGLSLKSNRNFNDFIEKNHENILECLANDDYIEMLKLIFIR